jgi:hypothetical protein
MGPGSVLSLWIIGYVPSCFYEQYGGEGKLFLQSNGKGTACNPGPNHDIVGRYDA